MALVDGVGASGCYVDDDELLYRCVKRAHWKPTNGGFRLSSQAFTDPQYRISVDRAKMCGRDPGFSQTDETDYVCSLLTSDVRAIGNVAKFQNNERVEQHAIDVDAAPIPGNAAHAEIYAHPQISSRGVFRRLQESLVHLSRWEEGFGPS